MEKTTPVRDITGIVLALLLLGTLLYSSYLVLQPFIPALVWAVMIVISSWHMMICIQHRLRNSRALAVTVMTLMLIMVLMVPLTIAFTAIAENIGTAGDYIQNVSRQGLPPPPNWLETIPLVGPKLMQRWEMVAGFGRDELLSRLSPYISGVVQWLLRQIGGMGHVVVHFLLTVIISALLYARGEIAARGIIIFARRIAQDRGEQAIILASQAIRAVASGVIGTALIQTAMVLIGLVLAGVPYAVILSSLAFLLSVIQIGTGIVLVGANIWLFYSGSQVAAWSFLVWAAIIMLSDNFIRPILIKRGANLPLVLILAGVIGGLISFGIIGIFVGPVMLAVTYTLLKAWTQDPAAE